MGRLEHPGVMLKSTDMRELSPLVLVRGAVPTC
jgi:hypothetical protein